jgi:homoserine kinase
VILLKLEKDKMNEIKIFSPASVANLSCGYDILGACLGGIGDEIIVRKTKKKGIKITKISGQKLTKDINKNVAGVSAYALLKDLNYKNGFEIEIKKGIKPGSGIGSSAASAAGSVYAINELLGKPFSKRELIKYAILGEKAACGSPIADNVAAVLLGGFTFVREKNDIIKLNSPINLAFTILHPQIEVKTSDSRALVKKNVSLKNMVKQSANLGAFVSALYTEDYNLLSRSMKDFVIEPLRSILIPNFEKLKQSSFKNNALGFGISGSGPSVFALSQGISQAKIIGKSFEIVYKKLNINFDIHTSYLNNKGIQIIESK